jgi:hypothetical protein
MSARPPCPHCGRDAPIVYRGIVPQCTACGALRPPLSSPSVNFAGKPARVGSVVARVAGWLVLLLGGAMALGLGLLFAALQLPTVGLAIAAPIALVALLVGGVLVWRGGSLGREGTLVGLETRRDAVLALAAHRGPITAAEAAAVLGIEVAEADGILTELAKQDPERLTLDFDDQGVVRYRAAGIATRIRVDQGAGLRAGEPANEIPEDGASEPAGKKGAGA